MKLLEGLKVLVVLVMSKESLCYTLQYYDCNYNNKIKTYHMDDTCMMPKCIKTPKVIRQTILQKKKQL